MTQDTFYCLSREKHQQDVFFKHAFLEFVLKKMPFYVLGIVN